MESQFRDKTFNSHDDFDAWLDKETSTIIHLKDLGQDMSMIWLHESGEILHSDFNATIYNGKFINKMRLSVNKPLYISRDFNERSFKKYDGLIAEEIAHKKTLLDQK